MTERNFKGPHIRGDEDTRAVMWDVLIALIPSLIWGVYAFGLRAAVLILLSLISFALAEEVTARILKKKSGLRDLSTVVGAVIFAMALPVATPYWIVPLGAILAVTVFGHLLRFATRYFLNSVLASLSLLYLIFPGAMTRLAQPFTYLSPSSVSPAIPEEGVATGILSLLKKGEVFDVDVSRLLSGVTAGGIGTVSGLLLLTGGLYLVLKRVISLQVCVSFGGTAALLFLLFPAGEMAGVDSMVLNLVSGGFLISVVAFANDPETSPVTNIGKILFGVISGLFTFLFRRFTPLAEGAGFAVMVACLFTRGLDVLFRPRVYGKRRDLWRILEEAPERGKALFEKLSKKKEVKEEQTKKDV